VVNDYNNSNSTSAKKKEAAAQSQKRQWLAPSSSNDDLTQKQPATQQAARRESEKPKESVQPKSVSEKPKEEKKTSLFKGSSTNPFAKRTNERSEPEKKEMPIQRKKSSSSEIKEDYSGGFIEDVYDDDFI
jgi:hypothetical protein